MLDLLDSLLGFAFNTTEAVERKAEQTVQQIEHFLRAGKFLWPVP